MLCQASRRDRSKARNVACDVDIQTRFDKLLENAADRDLSVFAIVFLEIFVPVGLADPAVKVTALSNSRPSNLLFVGNSYLHYNYDLEHNYSYGTGISSCNFCLQYPELAKILHDNPKLIKLHRVDCPAAIIHHATRARNMLYYWGWMLLVFSRPGFSAHNQSVSVLCTLWITIAKIR